MNAIGDVSGSESASRRSFVDQRVELMKRHWRNLPSMEPSSEDAERSGPGITIAISRQRGALGSRIGAELGKQLDWPVYDRELVNMIAQRSVLRAELLESIDEHDRPWLIETLTGLSHPGEISSAGYLYHLKRVMAALGSHGKCIIVGRGAAAFLPSATTLRVRVQAPLELRVERVASEMGITLEVARGHIEELERGRAAFVAQHFQAQLNDLTQYDLVFNTERLNATDCAGMISCAAVSMQLSVESEAKPTLP